MLLNFLASHLMHLGGAWRIRLDLDGVLDSAVYSSIMVQETRKTRETIIALNS